MSEPKPMYVGGIEMTFKPHRVQRKRTKGWKMPPNTVYVGRPTKWGNPWEVKKGYYPATVEEAVSTYRVWLEDSICGFAYWHPHDSLSELRGKNLACWCPLDQPCHADVLLELANP